MPDKLEKVMIARLEVVDRAKEWHNSVGCQACLDTALKKSIKKLLAAEDEFYEEA